MRVKKLGEEKRGRPPDEGCHVGRLERKKKLLTAA